MKKEKKQKGEKEKTNERKREKEEVDACLIVAKKVCTIPAFDYNKLPLSCISAFAPIFHSLIFSCSPWLIFCTQ